MGLVALALAAAAMVGLPVRGQGAPAPTIGSGSRIVKTFDFEEIKLGNHEEIPMFWLKVADRGFPTYSAGKFDRTVARSATTSFKLELDGGSVAYRLATGKIPINPSADYFIIAYVKTTPLKHARAEITAWLADDDGKLIASSESHSTSFAAPSDAPEDAGWHAIQLYIPGTDSPNARSLVLQAGLLQPQQLTTGVLGKFELYQQDLKGAAWFDDIAVYQLPRVSITPRATANIFLPNQKVDLDLTVSDLGQDALRASLTVVDAAGKHVIDENWPVVLDATRPWVKSVSRTTLPPGLYTATLDVVDSARKAPITRRQTQFLTLAPDAGEAYRVPAREFGLIATGWPVDAWDQLPHILKSSAAGLIQLPAWRRDMTEDALLRHDAPFDSLMLSLLKVDARTIASFSDVPSVLTGRLTAKNREVDDSILALLDADPAIWRPYVSFILARYANRVDFWQLGRQTDAFYAADPRYPKVYAKTRAELAGLLNAPKLIIPWDAFYEFDPAVYPDSILELHIPTAIKANQIPAYLRNFAPPPAAAATAPATDRGARSAQELMVVLDPLDSERYARVDRLSDFICRAIYARSANPKAILLDLPMTRRMEMFNSTSQPSELLLVYRTLVSQIGNARFLREFSPAPGVHAFLFDRQGTGTVVLWADHSENPPVHVSLPLGSTPVAVDMLGNTSPLIPVKGAAPLLVGTTPMFVTMVDARLVELRASFSLATSKFPAGAGSVRTSARIHNPYDTPLAGMLHLAMPKGWTADPPAIPVALQPNAELDAPITVTYPFNEVAGPKTINAHLTADGSTIDLTFQAALTSETVDMDCYCLLLPSGQLVLQQMITNISPEPVNATAYALVPGLARQQRYLLDLKPGQTSIKRYTFQLPGNPSDFLGKVAAMGLRQNDGKTLLTKSVPLE